VRDPEANNELLMDKDEFALWLRGEIFRRIYAATSGVVGMKKKTRPFRSNNIEFDAKTFKEVNRYDGRSNIGPGLDAKFFKQMNKR
jgi:hypothetical protein